MTTQEINELVKKIMAQDNICDAITMITTNEKDYKTSEFYKSNKIGLFDLIKMYKALNPIDTEVILKKIQDGINKLDLTNIQNILDNFVGDAQVLTEEFEEKVKEFKQTI